MAQESTQTTSQQKNTWANPIIVFLVVAILIAGSGLLLLQFDIGKRASLQIQRLFGGNPAIEITVVDSHPGLSAVVANQRKTARIYEEFRDIFPDIGEPTITVYLVNTPQLKFSRRWDDTIYASREASVNGTEAIVQLYVNTDAVKQSRWSEITVANQLELDLYAALYTLRDEITRGYMTAPLIAKEQMREDQRLNADALLQELNQDEDAQLFWVQYE